MISQMRASSIGVRIASSTALDPRSAPGLRAIPGGPGLRVIPAGRARAPAGPASGRRITAPAAPATLAASALPSGNSAVVRVDPAGAAGDDVVDDNENGGREADENGGDDRQLDS